MKKFTLAFIIALAISQNSMAQLQPGDLDTSFNHYGYVTTDIGADNNELYSVALQSDGKIVAAGYSVNNLYNLSVARYNSDGSIDNTFATGGIYNALVGGECLLNSVAIQANGKIVAGGYTVSASASNDFLLIRLNTDGTPDNSFGTNGVVTTDFNGLSDVINSISIQADGKIVATGYSTPSGGASVDITVARYNSNGTLDNSFSSDGKVVTPTGFAYSEAWTSIIQPDQKIIVGGYSEVPSDLNFTLIRYNTDGTLDNSFGTGGTVITDIDGYDEEVYSLALQNDGKIVAAGYANNDSDDDFAVLRYLSDGTPDSTFDLNGRVIADFFSDDDNAYGVNIQSDGKIVVTGFTYNTLLTAYVFALARYHEDGSLDVSFDTDGMVTTNLNSNDDDIYASLIQPDGKILVVGASDNSVTRDFALARYITGTDVGILEFTNSIHSFFIYPNPLGNNTHLQYELAKDENISVQLFDVQGKMISQLISNQPQSQGKHELNIPFAEQLPAGTYLLSIISNHGTVNIKLVKE